MPRAIILKIPTVVRRHIYVLCMNPRINWDYFFKIINLLKPTGHVMHQQFNIQQLYALPHTVFMCFVFI